MIARVTLYLRLSCLEAHTEMAVYDINLIRYGYDISEGHSQNIACTRQRQKDWSKDFCDVVRRASVNPRGSFGSGVGLFSYPKLRQGGGVSVWPSWSNHWYWLGGESTLRNLVSVAKKEHRFEPMFIISFTSWGMSVFLQREGLKQ